MLPLKSIYTYRALLVTLSGDTTWHLYKIYDDETELNDLAKQHPEVVKKLSSEWKIWADKNQVFPKTRG